jgi:hypothetical protein
MDWFIRVILIAVSAFAVMATMDYLRPKHQVVCLNEGECTVYEGPVHLTRNPDGTWSVKGVKTP